jgi:threonine/homoserine/homoserine lactone efflux protein
LAGIFWAISVFGICGIGLAFIILLALARLGVRGDEMLIPFVFSLMVVFGIAGLLVWQLSRLITASQQQVKSNANFERPAVKEYQPASLAAAPEAAPSVIEHTTRQFGTPVYKEPGARE